MQYAVFDTYCSATGIDKSDYKNKKSCSFGEPKWDWDAMKRMFDTNPIIQGAIKSQELLLLNFWGSEPLLWTKEASKYWDWVDKNYPKLKYRGFISTNGKLLGAKHIQEWIYSEHKKHGLTLQLSHDGLGQYCRSQDFDPLYDYRTKDFIVKCVKDRILDMFNCSLNNFNHSPIANFNYFNQWRFENHLESIPMLIKLNHNNDAEYTKDYKLTGDHLRLYMHEMEMLMQQAALTKSGVVVTGVYGGWPHEALKGLELNKTLLQQLWQPYVGYLENQMKRFDLFKGWGGCAQYSLKERDYTWCCNSLGQYVFCQLCNDPEANPNQKLERPENCKDCEYRYFNECHPCPDMVFADNCEYKKEYIRLMIRMKQYLTIIQTHLGITRQLKEELVRGNTNNCQCNNQCNNRCNDKYNNRGAKKC